MKNKIVELLNVNKFLSFDEIQAELETSYEELDEALKDLCNEYIIYKSKKQKYGLLESFNYYIGTIELKKKGFGFFKSDKLEEEVFIREDELDNALDKDTVLVWVDPTDSNKRGSKKEGSVVKVIKHNSDLICRIIKKNFNFDNKKLICETYPDVNIEVSDYKLAVADDIVIIKVIDVDLIRKNVIYGEIIKIIGNINDIGVDIKSIAYKYGLEDDFSNEVHDNLNEVNKYYQDNKNNELSRRKRINRNIITIDGEDAKDLDDAVSVEKLENGNYFLGVYIADVSYFVHEDSKIDEEALNRATSVYLVNKVIPMLPHKLCNDLCSLNEHEDKYVMACEMEIDKHGKVIDSNVFEGIINSNHRMTYTNVNKIIDYLKSSNKESYEELDLINKYEDILDMVQDMKDLSQILNRMRNERGSLNFDVPEAKFIIDDNEKVVDVVLRERFDAEKLIEEFMLIANETVASLVNSLELPFIYRIHDKPNSLKLERLKNVLKNSKYSLKMKSKNITPLALQGLLNEVGSDDTIISTMLLRMMAKAKYSSENIGHYGLASKCYTHFTSPIRRYPDLLVHRLLKKYVVNSEEFYSNYSEDKYIALSNKIENIASWSSNREVNATLCEYEVEDMKKAEYMEEHIGKVFEGKITSVVNFGLFVTLPNTIEGLVHIRTLDDDYYNFNDYKMCLIGERTNRTYKLGDKVKIKVSNASKESKEIDFIIINNKKNDFKNNTNMIKYKKKKR